MLTDLPDKLLLVLVCNGSIFRDATLLTDFLERNDGEGLKLIEMVVRVVEERLELIG